MREPNPRENPRAAPNLAVDVITIGNGANGNASQAETLPSASLCPSGTLAFSYGNSSGFLSVSISTPEGPKAVPTLTVTFYDSAGAVLYTFSKARS